MLSDQPSGDDLESEPAKQRSIRSGKRAKRRRNAYIQHQEAAGAPPGTVPVVHQGGVSRPVGTSRFWVPDADSEPSLTGDEGPLEVASSDDETSGAARASSSSVSLVTFRPTVIVPAAKSSILVQPLKSLRPQPPPVPPPRILPPPDSVSYRWNLSGSRPRLERFEWEHQKPSPRIRQPCVFIDFHQVSDCFRTSARTKHVDDRGRVPSEVQQVYQALHSDDHRVFLLSYLHSDWTRNNLLQVVESSEIPVDLVLTSDQPDGPRGKAAVIRGFCIGPSIIVDDNVRVISEASRLGIECVHIKVPKRWAKDRGVLPASVPSVKNLAEALPFIQDFLRRSA